MTNGQARRVSQTSGLSVEREDGVDGRRTASTAWPWRIVYRLQALLGARGAHGAIIALTLVMSAPILWLTLDSDDYFQLAWLSHDTEVSGGARAPWDLYAFAKDHASNVALREVGVWPWWADPDVLLAFFRPLASLSRYVDHALWPEYVPLMQLHSLAWFGVLLWFVSRIYLRLVPSPWVGGLALFLFASDEARAPTLAWLCNRNALISLAFGFGALAAHHRARADGSRAAYWLAPLCLALGLLGGETALQVGGYLLAYALFLDRGTLRARIASLLPYGAVVLVWAAAYKVLGYGARGSAYYLDPVRDPLGFLLIVPERMLLYALALFGGGSTDLFDLLPIFGITPRPYQLTLAILGAVLLVLVFRPLWRDPLVRFWAVGALLSALPACGVRPSDRMLTGAALGGMALLATYFGALVDKTYPSPRRWLLPYAAFLALVNLGYAPLVRPFVIAVNDKFDSLLSDADASLPRTPEVRSQTLVLLNPPWDNFALFIPLYRAAHDIPRPKHFRWLATGVSSLEVEHVDAHSLKITPSEGFLSSPSQQVMRSLDRPFHVGDRVALEGVTFEVLSQTADRRPKEVLARFDEPLEGGSLRFMQWGKHEYVPFALPPVGTSVTIPAVDLVSALAGR